MSKCTYLVTFYHGPAQSCFLQKGNWCTVKTDLIIPRRHFNKIQLIQFSHNNSSSTSISSSSSVASSPCFFYLPLYYVYIMFMFIHFITTVYQSTTALYYIYTILFVYFNFCTVLCLAKDCFTVVHLNLQFPLLPTEGAAHRRVSVITSAFKTKWVAPKLDNKAAVCCL